MKRVVIAILSLAAISFAGPNATAKIKIDMNPVTFGATSIDVSRVSTVSNELFEILIVADSVKNLDTYLFRLAFNRSSVTYLSAVKDSGAIPNILEKNGGNVIGIEPRVITGSGSTVDTLEFTLTLTGSDTAVAPDGFGLCARIRFQSLLAAGRSCSFGIVSATFLDSDMNRDSPVIGSGGTCSFVPVHVVSVSATAGGSVVPSGDQSVSHGNTLNVTATANTGYHFVNWSVTGGVSITNSSSNGQFTVTEAGTVTANFAINQYALTVGSSGNGTVNPSGSQTVNHGATLAVTATASTGYHFVNWTVTGGVAITNSSSSGQFTVTEAGTVTANFAINQYTVTVGSSGNGTVSPSGSQTVNYGATLSVTATASTGYHFVNWTVTGGVAITNSSSSGQFTVTEAGTVTANFAVNQYTVTVGSSGNGTVSPSGDQAVNHGATLAVTATASTGYHFVNWTVTGGVSITNSSSSGQFTVTGVGTVTANFAINQYTVTVGSSGNGTVSPSGDQAVNHGATLAVTATASTGYHFVNWTVTGGVAITNSSSSGQFTVTGAGTVTANFAMITFTLTVSSDGNGTVTPVSSVVVVPGESRTVTATPNAGYHFAQWRLVSGMNVVIADRYSSATTVTLNENDAEVIAEFVKGGSVVVAGIGTGADVFLYAQSGWIGRKVLDGPGTISDLAPGNYLIAVTESGKRTEYIDTAVVSDATVTVTVALRNTAPVVSDTLAGLSTADGRISGGSGASPVVADFDKNGAPELLVGSSDGTFLYFTKSGSVWVPASGPTTAAGGGLAVSGGIGCVRVADWNGDNRVDIIVSDLSNHILVFRNMSSTGGLVFETGSIIYTAGAGTLTGFDIADLNGDAKPDFVLGFVDGTVTTVSASGSFTWEDPAWDASSVVLVEGVPLNAGSGAMPCVTELTGDTGLDLLVANGAGQVMFYKNRNDGSFQDRGVMNAAGKPLEGNTIAVVFGEQGEFVSFIVSDASGKLSAGQGLLRGDFHADSDNEVNVMDLQVFGDAWGKIETDDGWVWKCNLDQTPDGSGKQVIDVFDLAIFGDSWLAKK